MNLKIYKSGQGYYTRMWSALTVFVVAAIGCYLLYQRLALYNIWIQTLVPSGVCVFFGFLTYWLVNVPSLADFMIAAEGELKKVSWSSKKELVASTIAVIVVVLLMAGMLGAVDFGFKWLFMEVIKIY